MNSQQKAAYISGRQFGKSRTYSAWIETLEIIELSKLMTKFYSSPVGELFK